MRTLKLTTIVIMGVTTLFLFFSRLDPAMEIDSLKSQIQLQKEEMRFLQNITNSAFSSCKITVISFESVIRDYDRDVFWRGRNVLWQGDEALVGPFRVKKKGTCIERIEIVNL
jgi:hypothetical protein